MYGIKTQDLALPFIIGGLIFFIGYCGVFYWQISVPGGRDPGLLVGSWIGTDEGYSEIGCTFNFYSDHTYTLIDNGDVIEQGTWAFNKGTQYILYNSDYGSLDYSVSKNKLCGLFGPEIWVRMNN